MIEVIEDVDTYIERLKSHDWFYDFTEDHRIWCIGRDQRAALNVAQEQFDPSFDLWNQHCPDMYKHKQ